MGSALEYSRWRKLEIVSLDIDQKKNKRVQENHQFSYSTYETKCNQWHWNVFEHIRCFFTISRYMEFLSKENLIHAYKNALQSRKNTYELVEFNKNLEYNLLSILHDLSMRKYQHGSYRYFSLSDSKKRYISSPTFRDHILHYMVYNICYPVLDKRMVYNSFATRKGKWHHQTIHYIDGKITKLIHQNPNLMYLKIDISKYFYAIPHELLLQKIKRYIQNPDLLYAITLLIESYETSGIFDDLFDSQSPYRKVAKKWVPIGALYSQLFANFFLSDIDWHAVQELKPLLYVRYMDDFLLVDTKERLLAHKKAMLQVIQDHGLLAIPQKIQINTLDHGLPFLGFKLQAQKWRLYVHINSRNKRKFRKTMDTIQKTNQNSFTRVDRKRLNSVIESRKWLFKHTKNWERYLGVSSSITTCS